MIDIRTYNEHMQALTSTIKELSDRVKQLEAVQIPLAGVIGPHDVLSATHPDTTVAAVVRGDLMTGQGVAPTWTRLAIGANNTVLASDGTDAAWVAAPAAVAHNVLSATHTDSTPAAAVLGDIMTAQAGPSWSRLAISVPAANVRNVLGVDNGDTVPAWKTALDANNPVAITVGAAALPGTSLIFSHRDHQHASPATWTATAHNLLSAIHGDTVANGATRGSLIYGNSTPAWDELVIGGISGSVVTRNANDVLWSTWALSGTAAQTYTFPATSTTLQGGTGSNPQVAYWSATANILAGDAGMTYDAANDSLTLLSAVSAKPVLEIQNTNGDAVAPIIEFYKNSASPADNDVLGAIDFYGEDSGGAAERYAYIYATSMDVTATDEAGGLFFYAQMNNTARSMLELRGYNGSVNQGTIIFNDSGQDVDYYVEAVGVADALFVRGSDGQITLGVLGAGYVNSDAGGVLSVTATATPTAHALLSASHSDVTVQAVSRGSLIYGAVATWDELAHPGGPGYALTTDATDVFWDSNPTWVGRHTFNAGAEIPNGQSVGITADVRIVFDSTNGFIEATLGDAAGADEFQVVSSTPAVVANIDSLGWGYFAGHVGIGVAANSAYHLYVYDAAVNTATTYYGINNYHQKTAGASDEDDSYRGMQNDIVLNQAGATYGYTIGAANTARLNDGTIGTALAARYIEGSLSVADLNGGTVYGPAYGIYIGVDQEAANTISTNIYGSYISVDADGTVSGSVYMLYLGEGSNVDYGIYQNGAALNRLEGDTGIGTTPTAGQLHVDQSSATGAQPAVYIDQGDVSEQHIVCSMNGADQDFPNILQLAVTGSPALWWDESENAFGWKNISGLLLQDGSWIGNSGSTARLLFNSAAATDYAYFSDCRVGVNVAAAAGKLHVDQSSATGATPVLRLDQGDTSEELIIVQSDAADRDLRILVCYVTGNPEFWWDESENSFGFKNISGILIENADWIGNSGTTARLVFDSSGATDRAFFHGCNTIWDNNAFVAFENNAGGSYSGWLNYDINDDLILNNNEAGQHIRADITTTDTNQSSLWWREAVGVPNMTHLVLGGGTDGTKLSLAGTGETYFQVAGAGGGSDVAYIYGTTTINQSSGTGADTVLALNQEDDSEEMINFIVNGTGAGYPVDTATAVGTAYARLRVAVNGTFKYIQLYNA